MHRNGVLRNLHLEIMQQIALRVELVLVIRGRHELLQHVVADRHVVDLRASRSSAEERQICEGERVKL